MKKVTLVSMIKLTPEIEHAMKDVGFCSDFVSAPRDEFQKRGSTPKTLIENRHKCRPSVLGLDWKTSWDKGTIVLPLSTLNRLQLQSRLRPQ